MKESTDNMNDLEQEYEEIILRQKKFFNSNESKEVDFRKKNLKKLYNLLKNNEQLLYDAIYKDFKKSAFETFETELSLIYHEIRLAIRKMSKWSRKKRVSTDLANMPGSSYIMPEPLGCTLVIGAWNYPYQLSFLPAAAAMSAGNTVIIKPSEISVNTSRVMAELINSNFDKNYLHIIEGGIEETTALLKQNFDKIFYTGSSAVGKIVMKAAAENLCPVILELGGKSPAIVLSDADIKMAAKRIVFGKFLNGGQTCVAPDYILVNKKVKKELLEEITGRIKQIFGSQPINSEAFTRIINQRNFNRLTKLIIPEKLIVGGDYSENDLYISPTVLDNISWDDAVMQEEIFGPILPLIEFESLEEIIEKIKEREKPLALYLFTTCSRKRERIFKEISFGSGMLNDCITQLTNTKLPFGGVGYSGMGSYHGKFGFDSFSHLKAVVHKTNLIEPSLKYPPYTDTKLKLMKWILGT